MPRLDQVGLGASDAQCAIRASRALRARRDFGLANGDAAAFHQWMAWKRHEGPTRRGLEPLAAAEAVLWAAMMAWGLDQCEP